MQIFLLDLKLEDNVSYYMDSHVIKTPPQIQQLLVTACASMRIKFPQIKNWTGMPAMPSSHLRRHPLVKWTTLDEANFMYVKRLGLQLCHEYQLRFGKPHYNYGNLFQFPELLPKIQVPIWHRFPKIIPQAFQDPDKDLITNYRNYYIEVKNHLAVWSPPRAIPHWYPEAAVSEGKEIAKAFKRARRKGALNEIKVDLSKILE